VSEFLTWPALAGGLTGFVVFVYGAHRFTRRRNQLRRKRLKGRLYK